MNDIPKIHTPSQYGGYDNARRLDKMYADWSNADKRAADCDYDNDALNEAAAALYDAYQQELFEAKKNAPRRVVIIRAKSLAEFDAEYDEFVRRDLESTQNDASGRHGY
jgi:hypothetical protein